MWCCKLFLVLCIFLIVDETLGKSIVKRQIEDEEETTTTTKKVLISEKIII